MPSLKETIKWKGRIHITAWQKNILGTEYIVDDHTIDNLLVTVGKDTMLRYLGNVTGGFQLEKIGVGDSTSVPSVADTALLGGSTLIKTIDSGDRVYVSPTLFLSSEYGYVDANFTWNELGLFDATTPTEVLVARQVDSTPLVKTSSKRAIVEWQITI